MTAAPDPLVGRRLSRYLVLERIGAGAMGVVYRARDERLDRDVAIKVLPPDTLPDDSSRRRFRREALTLSRLNHANIETAFDFDSEGGTDFLVTELVPGRTLLDRLAAGGPLPEAEAVAVGIQVAEALAAAHEQGVVHGDLKPANVLMTPKGQVKLLDFGLAFLREAAGDEEPTRTLPSGEGFAGTLGYAAPELFADARPDVRSDVYAVGVVLFELATGRRPHQARQVPALIQAVLRDPVPSPRDLQPGLSPAFERIVLEALARDPARRTPSAAILADRLRRVGGAPEGLEVAASAIRAIAVIPLVNLSGDPAQEFFADGMTEALIGSLTRIGALRVISRTSAMTYKGVTKPLPEIARELNVDAIVEGSVARAGTRVRVSAHLVQASNDTQVWSDSYDREIDDILRLQADVAQSIARSIQVQVTPEERARLSVHRTVNPEAHLACLRGRYLWNRWTPDDLRAAIDQFRHALAIDPGYAVAYAGLADSYAVLGNINAMPHGEAYPTARAAALQGLAIDDSVAELHGSLGYVLRFHEWDWPRAEWEFRRSLELNPGYATALRWHAQLLSGLGRHEQAIAEARRALDMDPLSLIIYSAVGDVYFYARQFDEAIDYYRRSVAMDARFLPGHTDLARACEQKGLLDEAMAEYRLAAEIEGSDPGLSAGLAHTLALAGRRDESRAILGRLIERHRREFTSTFSIASIHAGLGDVDGAFGWLTRAFELRDGAMAFLKVHPRLDGLRHDPRFDTLLRQMRLDDASYPLHSNSATSGR